MKIICVDNFNPWTEDCILVAENVAVNWAERIVELLNERHGSVFRGRFFRMVKDDYTPRVQGQ